MGKLEDLKRLQKLKENGTLTDEEFKTEKERIMNGKHKNHTGLIIIITIVIVFVILKVISDNAWKSSGEYGVERAKEKLTENIQIFKNK